MADVIWNGDFWQLEAAVQFFGGMVNVYIVTDGDDEPTQRQLDTARAIASLPTSMLGAMQKHALSYYNRCMSSGQVNVEGISIMYNCRRVLVPEIGDCVENYLVVTGECDWEEEHGIQFVIENEQVLHCGPNTGVAINPCWEDVVDLPLGQRHEAIREMLDD